MMSMLLAAALAAQPAPAVWMSRCLDTPVHAQSVSSDDRLRVQRFRAPRGGVLTLVAATASRDPGDRQFVRIARAFADAQPTRAFYEGPDGAIADEAEDTIRAQGQPGFLRFLASRGGATAARLDARAIDAALARGESVFVVVDRASRSRCPAVQRSSRVAS